MVRRPERGDSLFSQEELDGLGLNVKDRMDESSSVTFEHLEQMSETEMRAIGIPFLDGHKCLIENQTSVGSDNFCMIVSFSWLDEMSEANLEVLRRMMAVAGDAAVYDDDTFEIGRIEGKDKRLLCVFNHSDEVKSIAEW